MLQQTIDEVLAATPLRFPADSASPGAGAAGAVDRLAGVLRATPGPRVTVEGHTAPTGEETGDAQELSQRRAEEIVRRLEAAGVPAGSLTAVGVGSDRSARSSRPAGGWSSASADPPGFGDAPDHPPPVPTRGEPTPPERQATMSQDTSNQAQGTEDQQDPDAGHEGPPSR